jgi:hypothetical protein
LALAGGNSVVWNADIKNTGTGLFVQSMCLDRRRVELSFVVG